MHLRRRAVVVRDRVEAHVLRVRDTGLQFSHDMVNTFLEVRPGGGEIGVLWWHRQNDAAIRRARHAGRQGQVIRDG